MVLTFIHVHHHDHNNHCPYGICYLLRPEQAARTVAKAKFKNTYTNLTNLSIFLKNVGTSKFKSKFKHIIVHHHHGLVKYTQSINPALYFLSSSFSKTELLFQWLSLFWLTLTNSESHLIFVKGTQGKFFGHMENFQKDRTICSF